MPVDTVHVTTAQEKARRAEVPPSISTQQQQQTADTTQQIPKPASRFTVCMKTGVCRALSLQIVAATTKRLDPPITANFNRGDNRRDNRQPCLTESMLGRANKNYAAQNPAVASATRLVQKTKIEQALLPSSSSRDGIITDYCKTSPKITVGASRSTSASSFRRFASSSSTGSHPGISPNALNARSPNISTASNLPFVKGSSSVVTLCNTPDSFLDNLPDPDRPQVGNAKIQQAEEIDLLAYGIDPDDFTDDENLGLDFKSPHALPTPQLLNSTEKHVESTVGSQHINMHSSLSWPPSSPSHHLPPLSRSASAAAPLPKRGAPTDPAPSFPLPTAKKRTMPKHWSKVEDNQTAFDKVEGAHETTTHATKTPGGLLWDATASAVKAQKKHLKDSQKKSVPGDIGPGGRDDGPPGPPGGTTMSLRKPITPTSISLSTEQQHVKNLVCIKNASVFFTGPAGTGKSVLMRAIIRDLQKKHAKDPERLGVTASTGLAACNIGGMTLHSFAGIGLGKEDVQTLVRKIRRNPKAKSRWLRTKTLVIDEISMVDGDLFDKLSNIGRTIRSDGRPWGGIQLVLTGDFFQLPPVPDRDKRDVKFAFEAATWNTSIDHTIGLNEVFRQKDPGTLQQQHDVSVSQRFADKETHSSEFANMLNEMRLGQISDKTVQIFKSLSRPIKFDDELEVTELYVALMLRTPGLGSRSR